MRRAGEVGNSRLETSSAAITTNLSNTTLENLPSNGRRWSNFALLAAGVTPDQNGNGLLSFRGISVLLNNNTIDGVDNNQAFFSEERGRTRIGYSTTQAAVQEFQVNTSNYAAEYGRAAGGVVNTVTRSGGNQFHGQAFFYDRDNDWGATNPYTTLTQRLARRQLFDHTLSSRRTGASNGAPAWAARFDTTSSSGSLPTINTGEISRGPRAPPMLNREPRRSSSLDATAQELATLAARTQTTCSGGAGPLQRHTGWAEFDARARASHREPVHPFPQGGLGPE